MRKMMSVAAAAAALCVASTHAQFDVEQLKGKMDVPLPGNIGGYIKQAAPFMKMFTKKVASGECKTKFEGAMDTIKTSKEVTLRSVLQSFCDMGDDCFADFTTATLAVVHDNSFIKAMVDKFLKSNSLSLEMIEDGAPLLYMGVCANIGEDFTADEEDEAEADEPAEEAKEL